MKRIAIIGATSLVATGTLLGILALGAAQRPASRLTGSAEGPPFAPAAHPRAPKLTLAALAPELAAQRAGAPGLEPSLAAVEQEAQDIALALARERDPDRRAKLARYAEAIEQIRDSLR
jgi:hypothetical protein